MASVPMCHYLVEAKRVYQKSLDDAKTEISAKNEKESELGNTNKHLPMVSESRSSQSEPLKSPTVNLDNICETFPNKGSSNANPASSIAHTNSESSHHSHLNCPFLRRVQDILASLDQSENDRKPQGGNNNSKSFSLVSNVSQEKAESNDTIFSLSCQFINPASNNTSDKPYLMNNDQDRKAPDKDKQNAFEVNLKRDFAVPDKQIGHQNKDVTSSKTNHVKFDGYSSKYTTSLAKEDVKTNTFLPEVKKGPSSMIYSQTAHQQKTQDLSTLQHHPNQGENKDKMLCAFLNRKEHQPLNKTENQISVRNEVNEVKNNQKCIKEASVDDNKSSNHICNYLDISKSSSTIVKCDFLRDTYSSNSSRKEPASEAPNGDKTGLPENTNNDTKPLLVGQASPAKHICNYLQDKRYDGGIKCDFLEGSTSEDSITKTSERARNSEKFSTINESKQMNKLPNEVSEIIPSIHKCNYLDMSKDSKGKVSCALLEKMVDVLSSEKEDSDAATKSNGTSNGNQLKENSNNMVDSSNGSDVSGLQKCNYENKNQKSISSCSFSQMNEHEVIKEKEPIGKSDIDPMNTNKTALKQDSKVNGTEVYNVSHIDNSPRYTQVSCEYLNTDKSQLISTKHVCEYLTNRSDGNVHSEPVKYTERGTNGEQNMYDLDKVNYKHTCKLEGSASVTYNQVGWNENNSQQSVYQRISNTILQIQKPVYQVSPSLVGEMKNNNNIGTAQLYTNPGLTNEHSFAIPSVKPQFHYAEVPPNFGIMNNTTTRLSSTNSAIPPLARFSSVVSRKAVNASYKNFLLRLPKCNSTELPDNISKWGNIKTNKIVHAAYSFKIWNYVDKRGKRRGNSSGFNYSRFKKQGHAFTTPAQRGEKQSKSYFMETAQDARTGDQLKKTSFTSVHSRDEEMLTNTKSKRESLEKKIITKKKTRRRSKYSKSQEGTIEECNSSDIDDLQENDRELLKSISPHTYSPRLNDLGLLGEW